MQQGLRAPWVAIALCAGLSATATALLTLQTGMNLDGAGAGSAGLANALGVVFFVGVFGAASVFVTAVAMLLSAQLRATPKTRPLLVASVLLLLPGPVGAVAAEAVRVAAMR